MVESMDDKGNTDKSKSVNKELKLSAITERTTGKMKGINLHHCVKW